MRRSPLKWFFVLLLCAAGFWLLFYESHQSKTKVSVAQSNSLAGAKSSVNHAASTNAVKSAAALTVTNKFAWRLSNTSKPIKELIHNPHALLLENAFIDTTSNLNLSIPKNLKAKGDPGAYLVQARGPISPAFRILLADVGATVVSYIPNNAFLVRTTQAIANGLEASPLVQAVIPYEPYYKVQPQLISMADQPLPPQVQLNLALFPEDSQGTIQQITQDGGRVLDIQNSAAGYPIVKVEPPSDWTVIADLPGVHVVETYRRRSVANDLARPTLGVAADSITPTNYLNLTGKNVMVEVNDTGIDTNHPDFGGPGGNGPERVSYNNPAFGVDTDGHGTHVAGIIAGDGTKSETVTNASGSILFMPPPPDSATNGQFRGKAPLAQMFSMPYNDDDQTLQQTAATNGALVSNNSWDYSGDYDYDLQAASYDAATRDALPFITGSQPVAFVFSAGNEGNTAGTIDSPATAKNVITVGALEQLRYITNQVIDAHTNVTQPWLGETDNSSAVPDFSSCGNVGIGTEGTFGRFKPDVVAPGTFVVSCRSGQWDTDAYYNPVDNTFYDFPDFIPSNSVSVAPFQFFVPSNTIAVYFNTVTNIFSPNPPLPSLTIYASTNLNSSGFSNPFGLIGTNSAVISAPLDPSTLGIDWSVEVSNTTASAIAYDLIVDVVTTNNDGNYFEVLSNLNQNLGTTNPQPYYRYETGTSMAAASISGFLALIQDYFTNQFYQPFTPSPALLKAMTINGARATAGYDFQVNNSINFEGWGLPDLSNSIPNGLTNLPVASSVNQQGPFCSTFFRDQNATNALATGDRETFIVNLNTNTDVFGNFLPLRVTVAWTDPPGDPIAALKLVNSLELVVTDLDNPSLVYYGNDIAAGNVFNSVETSNNPPVIDSINNVQNIYIQPFTETQAQPDSDYSVTVIGNSVNVNAVSTHTNNDVQDFAIVISAGDMGQVSKAMQVTDGGIISSPSGYQTLTIGQTNTVLLNQIAGANTPLLGTNIAGFTTNVIPVGTNGQFVIGMTNQWHFYIVTNTTSFTNAAFITFGAETLSIPRMGVFANSDANATTPGADIDLLVAVGGPGSTDPNAFELTNLWPSVVSNCVNNVNGDGASLASGGTDFVAYTNSVQNQIYYIGVKSESHMAVEYGFIPIFTDTPFSGLDSHGNEYISGLNVPVPIPDGTPSHPGLAFVFALAMFPIELQNVVVTNQILHQNFGNLVGSVTHSGTTVVLNSHDSLASPPGPYTLIYDDSGQNDVPGSRPSDGPGSLRSYQRGQGQGVWQMTQEGTAVGQTGEVLNTQIFLQKYQNPGQGTYATIQPNSWFYTFLDVPNGVTNLQLYGAYATSAGSTPPLQMFLNTGGDPTATSFLFEADLTNPPPMPTLPPPLQQQPGPWNVISDGPPLQPQTYYIGVFNPSSAPQTVYLAALLNGPLTPPQPVLFSATNSSPITVDAVTNATIYVSNTNTIQSANVGIVVQYPRISDLAFTLISPTGQRILLMENRGGPTATNAGGVFFITNNFSAVASGSFEPNTNYIHTGANSGSFNISWNMYTIQDQMTVYYGTNPATWTLLFDSGLISGSGTTNISYGPGAFTDITVIMNQFGNTNAGTSDAWDYNINGVESDFNYLTFTSDTNLTTTPIKFAIPPFDLRDMGTNYTFGDLDFATNGDYFSQTNIYDPFGGWTVPTNLVTQVISNIVVTNNYNMVSVVSNQALSFNGTNYLALGYGVIQRTNLVTPNRLVTFTYEYRGPGIAGWWRGEGDARDSSDAEQRGQNGSLIGRFGFPAGQVSQAFQMENNGQEYDFAGTNGYVQIRQQPFLTQQQIVTGGTNEGNGTTSTNIAIVQASYLDVGTGPGFTVEGWINPTNVSFQQPLVEWLARVPTNGSDTNLTIRAGPFLYRGTTNYYYLLGATNWTTSETWAEQLGGHLVTVNSANEQNWIFDTFGAFGGRNRNLWIGLTNFNLANFGYVGGETNIAYTNWLFMQPTNCNDPTRNYTFMFGSTNEYAGLWALANNDGIMCGPVTNICYGVVEVATTNFQTNGVQFWISVTNVPGTTNIIDGTNGCLFANLVDITNGSHWIYSAPGLVLVQSNTWQHVALTYDTNSGNAMLFYDGTNVATTNWGVSIIPKTTGDVLLGKDMSLLTNNYYGGQMDEMSIYNRALSDTEIQAIYSVSAYTTNRLVGKFDPSVTPPLSLAEAQVVLGNMTNTILGENNTWQQGSFTFETQTNTLPMQITGLQPGMLFDSFGFSEAPLGNLYYQPEQSLDDLQGENASGAWTLEIWNTRNNTLASNAVLLSWQLQMILQTNTLPPVSVAPQIPTTITVLPGQTVGLAISVPPWASTALNTLVTSTVPLNVFFNATNLMDASPPDVPIFTPPAVQTGSELLTTTSVPTQTNITSGKTYYIGLQNPGTQAATAVFEVDFNIIALTNAVSYYDTLTNSVRYFSFDVSTNNPYEATFQLLKTSGNADLVVSKGTLPTLTSADYGSFDSGKANENIYVLTNSMPVPLSPGTWYLGVFNRGTNAVNYSVLAQELDFGSPAPGVLTTNLIPLTNGVPFDFTAGPGAALTNFFTFVVTNTWTVTNSGTVTNYVPSVHFELYNLTGNGDLTVQTNAPPFAPPFYQSSQEPGTIPELIQVVTNSGLTNLAATYYLGVPNETTNLIHFTIIAVIDTNNYFPAFPGAEGAGASALGGSFRNGYTNNTVYHVVNLNDSGSGSLRDAVSSTNRTIVFDISGVIELQSPLVITNSYLTIAGQTAPEGGITVAGEMTQIQSAHDIVVRDLRFYSDIISASNSVVTFFNGFESGNAGSSTYFPPQKIAGWNIDFGSIDLLTNTIFPAQWYSYEGRDFIDLDGSSAGGISTNVATVPGLKYKLNFAYTENPGASVVPTAQILLNGNPLGSVAANVANGPHLTWLTTNFVFTATSPSNVLAFHSMDSSGDINGVLLDAISLSTNLIGSSNPGDSFQVNTASNVIADHISVLWSSNNDLSVLNSTNVTVQWSIISDSLVQTNGQTPPLAAQVRFGSGTVTLHHNLFADNYTGSPRIGDNVSLDFVNNVIYNWVTNAGYSSSADIANNPPGFTNRLNYRCNYLIAGPNTITTNIAFWGGTNTTWIFQTNNFLDGDTNGFLNGANTKWDMFTNWNGFTNLYTETNQFRLPPVQVDEAYMAYEKVLDFAGVSMFRRDRAETNIVENVRRQMGAIISSPGILPTNSSTLIFLNSSGDGIPDFWKITFGQAVTNSYNNFALDSSGYSELEEFDNWLAAPHAVTTTNTPVGVNLQKLFGKTGNLSFFLTNNIHGTIYLTNVLGSYTNTGTYSNSIAVFTPTNNPGFGTNYFGFGSFDVYVTNNDTVAYFGPVTVSVFIGSTQPSYSQFVGILLPDPTNNIGANTIQWYQVNVPTNAVAATNTLVFAGAPMNVWFSTNFPPTTVFPGDVELLTAVTNGVAVLTTNSAPLLVPGSTYYLGIQNTNDFGTNYAVRLAFNTTGGIPITGGSPITNTVPAGGTNYYAVTVPPNAIAATNILDFANGGSVNLWFNQNTLPGGPGDYELLAGFTGTTPMPGNPVLTLSSTPPLIPGSTYYLAVANPGASPVTYAIEVDFELFYTPPVLPTIPTNLFAVAGTTFTVTNTATDTNSGTLFYSLTTQPPVGATIDTNGVITWNVPANEPVTNILFTTIVTNSFTDQSATNSFTVTVIPEVSSTGPLTNSVPGGGIDWLAVNVPTNAIWATNILLFATNLPVNVLFTTNFPPSTAGAYTLMFDETNGTSILGLNTVPTNIVQGGTYFLGVQNTNSVAVTYAIEVNFDLLLLPAAPFSETLPATMVTDKNAQLNGFATPNTASATAWFEYGVNTNYGFSTAPQALTSGNSVQFVTNYVGLSIPGQVYHYRLDVSNALGVVHGGDQLFAVSGVAVWGQNIGGVTNVPVGLSNEVAIAAEMEDGVALNSQGQVSVWGDDTFSQTLVPANLTNVANIAAGNGFYALALQNGTVTGWGDNSSGQTSVPAGLSNVVAIAAGEFHGLALQNDGTVVAWGANGYGQTSMPAGLKNVVAIAAGSVNSLALLNNGTVVAWGGGETNSGNYPDYGQSIVPAGLTNVVAIASYGYTSTALKSDGTVVAWGENNFGQAAVPGGLNDVVAIANGLYHSLAVQETGRAVGWGNNVYGESTIPASLTNIYAIAGGNYFSMALESPLSINLSVTPITGGTPPQTNTVAADSVVYYSVAVPANAVEATNLLSFATAPLNIWFNQGTLPQPANPPDTLLLGGSGSGASAVLTTNGVPPLLPGQTYYLAIQNTNSMSVSYVFGVNFNFTVVVAPTNPIPFSSIVYTNMGGTNGFLLSWYAPTNDIFQVQETPNLQPVVTWQTFTNIIPYTGPPTPTNGLFQFFDDGSQYPFGPMRFYRLLLLSGGASVSPPVLPAISNQVVVAGTTLSVTNTATDPNPGTLAYTLTTSPSVSATISSSGVITWVVPTNQPSGNILFTTIVTNSLTTLSATNYFTVDVLLPSPIFFSSIIYTNVTGTNGFLLSWYAPTNDIFQVQQTPGITPATWLTFSNIVTYSGPLTTSNGLFQFFDNGSQYPFGPERFYRLLLFLQAGSGSDTVTLHAISNYLVSVSQPLEVTNTATDSNTGALLAYSLAHFPTPATNATISANGIINWEAGTNDAGEEFKFTTTVSDNGVPPASATNQFTVFVLPAPSIIGATVTSTNTTIRWTASSNDLFQVEWATNLTPPVVWKTFPQTNSSTTNSFTFTDTNAPATMKFYRLLWLPLP